MSRSGSGWSRGGREGGSGGGRGRVRGRGGRVRGGKGGRGGGREAATAAGGNTRGFLTGITSVSSPPHLPNCQKPLPKTYISAIMNVFENIASKCSLSNPLNGMSVSCQTRLVWLHAPLQPHNDICIIGR